MTKDILIGKHKISCVFTEMLSLGGSELQGKKFDRSIFIE